MNLSPIQNIVINALRESKDYVEDLDMLELGIALAYYCLADEVVDAEGNSSEYYPEVRMRAMVMHEDFRALKFIEIIGKVCTARKTPCEVLFQMSPSQLIDQVSSTTSVLFISEAIRAVVSVYGVGITPFISAINRYEMKYMTKLYSSFSIHDQGIAELSDALELVKIEHGDFVSEIQRLKEITSIRMRQQTIEYVKAAVHGIDAFPDKGTGLKYFQNTMLATADGKGDATFSKAYVSAGAVLNQF